MINDVKCISDWPLVTIPGGEISLRDDRNKTRWTTELKSFQLAKFPVTVDFYRLVMNPSSYPSTNASDGGDNPVVNISWNDAISFCNQLSIIAGLKECYSTSSNGETISFDGKADGYRLPTEAEWQHACKAGTTGYRYDELDHIAWYKENAEGSIHPVGKKAPNDWGLYDMLGNVWEWCWDLYDEQVYGSYRIFRGGSWAEAERGCGATCRRRSHPTFRIDDLGFRLARSHT
ncbi:formylglycine-generating enzyme required for sulfatase activity [Paenibacillus endophyticus]|uniref:Formylglycine-generating enzyme required for sulfatase activity n=1 Tax=Paenibacillus endophyticus TaxID=1294268 RepID=A0A7W5GBF9_9BACL|nr:SUMF1/EgtB/PvdO family nonheme iron enzyme [Paenibacillus endophyticus]MBB3153775.1 formylglycine-generating enzyme required for sulfatase activity [Paenibacillus endophyticus]